MALRILISLLLVVGYASSAVSTVKADTADAYDADAKWITQLVNNGFRINDPAIRYPKFPRFCVKVYNWGDRVFNTYDSDYVVGTGRNWKAIVKSTNSLQTYNMRFNDNSELRILSNIHSDLGFNLCFMAVSLSYTINANRWFHNVENPRKSLNFNFCSALFSANFEYQTVEGGAKITRFGNYENSGSSNGSKKLDMKFDGVKLRSIVGDAYYFFNHNKYSQAAAYCYSKYQLKSAGSWIAGLAYSHQNIDLDFKNIPPDMWSALSSLKLRYDFHYADYSLLGGYGYNWVLKPRKWLINGTIMPSVGYRHSYEGTTDGRKDMFAANIRGMFSVVYNYKALFAALEGRIHGSLYFTDAYTFFNSTQFLMLNVGMRF